MKPPVNGDFVSEGTFLALPPCFPGVSLPPPADETRIHRLLVASGGEAVFAATRGPRPHLLKFLPKGALGYAVDLGGAPEAVEISALAIPPRACSAGLLAACLSDKGASIYFWPPGWADDGIQEWQVIVRPPRLALDLPTPRIFSMVCGGAQIFALGEGVGFFLRLHDDELTLERTVQIPEVFPDIFSPGSHGLLTSDWRLLPLEWNTLTVGGGERLPYRGPPATVATAGGGFLVWADDTGAVHEWSGGEVRACGSIPLLPVHSLCRLPDGRIYASAGPEIAHWYVLEDGCQWARDLGVPVSTLTTRRYGFQFSHMLAGQDGEIYIAEDDRGGHLWIYFPPCPVRGMEMTRQSAISSNDP